MKHFIFALLTVFVVTSCVNEDFVDEVSRRTIIVYFNAENNLSSDATADYKEMIEGSNNLPSDCNLIVYMDNASTDLPFIAKLSGGQAKKVRTLEADVNSSSPEEMKNILQWIINKYPAKSFGMTFWGHGTGSLISNDTIPVARSYGGDNGVNSSGVQMKWINIPTMAKTLNSLGLENRLDFLFFDVCLMQSVEIAYEFRNTADYIIGSCCETPSFGAPYKEMVSAMASSTAAQAAKDIVNTYIDKTTWGTIEDESDGICISAVKTSAMENLMYVTKSAIDTIKTYSTKCPLNLSAQYSDYPAVSSCIYYWLTSKGGTIPIFYDINDVMRHNLCAKDYATWHSALDDAVIAKRHPRDITELEGLVAPNGNPVCDWIPYTMTSVSYFKKFLLNDDTFGGLSIFIPQTIYAQKTTPNMNEAMFKYQWWQDINPSWKY